MRQFFQNNYTFWENLMAQEMKFFINDFFSKRDQIRSFYAVPISSYFSKQVFLYSIKFFRTATFSTKLILQKRYLLRTAIFSEKPLSGNNSEKQYSVTYFFRRGTFTQPNFLSTATLSKIYLG